MSYFIFFHSVGGLDRDAAGIEGDGFSNQADHGRARLRVRWGISNDDDARRLHASLRDTQKSSHFQIGNFLFVENFDGQASVISHSFSTFSENARGKLVRRLIDEVARKILRFGNDFSNGQALFARRLF